jgi:hypothetical protein
MIHSTQIGKEVILRNLSPFLQEEKLIDLAQRSRMLVL